MLDLKYLCHPIERLLITVGYMIEMRQLCLEMSNISEEELNKLLYFIIVLALKLSEVIDEFLAFVF